MAQPETGAAYPAGLIERGVEVLRVIAAGETISEITEELVIAEGMAPWHLANIYEAEPPTVPSRPGTLCGRACRTSLAAGSTPTPQHHSMTR